MGEDRVRGCGNIPGLVSGREDDLRLLPSHSARLQARHVLSGISTSFQVSALPSRYHHFLPGISTSFQVSALPSRYQHFLPGITTSFQVSALHWEMLLLYMTYGSCLRIQLVSRPGMSFQVSALHWEMLLMTYGSCWLLHMEYDKYSIPKPSF